MDENSVGGPLTRRGFLAGASLLLLTAADADGKIDSAPAAPVENWASLVHVLQGTDSAPGFSRGNTLPLVARPFGMAHWSLQTRPDGSWFFDPKSPTIIGIRATHQPSPWMGDYGNFTVMAQTGTARLSPKERAAAYAVQNPQETTLRPDYVSLQLSGENVRIEMSPTERCAIFRFTFPKGQVGRVILDAQSLAEIVGKNQINGVSRRNSGGVSQNFGGYFVARFDTPFARAYVTQNFEPVADSAARVEARNAGAVAEFDGVETVVLRVATSFISHAQAERNLDNEIGRKTLEAVRDEGRAVWNQTLGRVRITGGSQVQRETFYSCLYRAHLFPRMLHEKSERGWVHYSPYDGEIHDGVLYGDSGFWDTYRTLFPLLSLLQPERLGEMVQGFVNAYQEGGWLPQWPSPGYRAVMIGTHLDAVIADAFVKNIPGFDHETAYAALRRDATVPGDPRDRFGRVGFADYVEKGYVPADKFDKSTSRSLDYYYDDFCVSQVAALLKKNDDAQMLRKRAVGYRALYDPAIGFFWGKNADGSWQKDFDEWAWGNPYVEGGPWQSTWAVPHDPAGLISLMGGRAKFRQKLDRFLYQPPTFKPGSYGGYIHEMLEMGAVNFGQYDHGNQPTHHILHLYTAAGSPWKAQYWTRRVLDQLYSPQGFAGDEDNGEMSAWYIFNALGLYPLCPGHPSYVLASPLFPRAEVTVGNKTLVIEAPKTSKANVYVRGVSFDGKAQAALFVSHDQLLRGGRLRFEMDARPTPRRFSASDLPHSLSPYRLDDGGDPFAVSLRINCGGDATGDFVGDCFFEGGGKTKIENTVANAQNTPAIVYHTERWGEFAYKIPLPALPAGRSYTLRLHFAEITGDAPGKRLINVALNGKAVITRWDIFDSVGANHAIVREFKSLSPDANGELVIALSTPPGSPDRNAILSGIEVFS